MLKFFVRQANVALNLPKKSPEEDKADKINNEIKQSKKEPNLTLGSNTISTLNNAKQPPEVSKTSIQTDEETMETNEEAITLESNETVIKEDEDVGELYIVRLA